jgi:hypothetical protein
MLMSPVPEWLLEPDIRTYQVEAYKLDYIMDGNHIIKEGYLLKLHRNGKIRQVHFFTNKKQAEKLGKKYMKEEGTVKDN